MVLPPLEKHLRAPIDPQPIKDECPSTRKLYNALVSSSHASNKNYQSFFFQQSAAKHKIQSSGFKNIFLAKYLDKSKADYGHS